VKKERSSEKSFLVLTRTLLFFQCVLGEKLDVPRLLRTLRLDLDFAAVLDGFIVAELLLRHYLR
jgi:hypothetical protein